MKETDTYNVTIQILNESKWQEFLVVLTNETYSTFYIDGSVEFKVSLTATNNELFVSEPTVSRNTSVVIGKTTTSTSVTAMHKYETMLEFKRD